MIKDELAAYTANIIKRVGAEQAEVLFRGQIGEAGRVAGLRNPVYATGSQHEHPPAAALAGSQPQL